MKLWCFCVLLLGLAIPSAGNACSLCVDAASRVTLPGVLDAGQVLLLFFGASAALMLFGRVSGVEWRLGSKLYWLVGVAAVLGAGLAGRTGLTLAAGPLLLSLSLMRVYKAARLPSPSTHELLAALLAGLFVIAAPAAFLLGNQSASSPEHLFASLASRNPVTAKEALKALQNRDDASALSCERLTELQVEGVPSQESRPMEWFGLIRLAERKGSCAEAVLWLQDLCDFPDDARMNASLNCAGRPKR